MNRSIYLQELRERLYFRGATRQRANDIVAEVESHLVESGEDPVEAFGRPDRYAALLLRGRWHTTRFLFAVAVALVAGVVGIAAVVATGKGDAVASVRAGEAVFATTLFVAAALIQLPAAHNRLPGQGARILLVLAAILIGGYVQVVVSGTTAGDVVLLALPVPAAIVSTSLLLAAATGLSSGPRLVRWWRRSRAARTDQPR